MEIKAAVHSIVKLKEYFFLVPDYQREYVWKVDDQVDKFLEDIDNEFDANSSEQKSYFIGSIIIVKNKEKYDVIDGQQRLTTIVLTLCALRDLLKTLTLNEIQKSYEKTISQWLSDFDMETNENQVRLELQYEESKDFLRQLILMRPYTDVETASIKKMQQAYESIKRHLEDYLLVSSEVLGAFTRYFLTKIDLVVIESENISSALKIFETINQRGAGLNAMDLVKNLLFSQAKEDEFQKIKEKWKNINAHLQRCGEEQSPLRFLRYFMMARYHDGILREDDIYNWIISLEGKQLTRFESQPLLLASELEKLAKRYADLVVATINEKDGGEYPAVTRIGFINKFKSRQHLVLMLALKTECSKAVLEKLAEQLESFFFFSNTLGIQAKYNEALFTKWAVQLRSVVTEQDLACVINLTLLPYLKERLGGFKQAFLTLKHTHYNPQYRQRYILGCLENTLLRKAGLPEKGLEFFNSLQVEHILPQTPKAGVLTAEFADIDDYSSTVGLLGNVTLLESTINQAVNNHNDLIGGWFSDKQTEYAKSNVTTTALLNHEFSIGKNTQLNKCKVELDYTFTEWNKKSIVDRQQILLRLSFETWLINNKRIDADQ